MSFETAGTTSLQKHEIIKKRYRIIDLINEGGSAIVYEAFDVKTGRHVAVKLLNADLHEDFSDYFEQRFTREVIAASTIKHPNIVDILDFGFYGEIRIPYVVMDKLQGPDLGDVLDTYGAMAPARAQRLIMGVVEALSLVHAKGIVHRDFKPENLVLIHDAGTGEERLVIIDYGLAKMDAESSHRLTKPNQMIGTPRYMPPELVNAQTVTPALDVYQMALIFAEMIIGQPLVDADDPFKCVQIHMQGNIVIPDALQQGDMGPVLIKALSLNPEDRHSNAAEFAQALKNVDPTQILVDYETLSVEPLEDTDIHVGSSAETNAALPKTEEIPKQDTMVDTAKLRTRDVEHTQNTQALGEAQGPNAPDETHSAAPSSRDLLYHGPNTLRQEAERIKRRKEKDDVNKVILMVLLWVLLTILLLRVFIP